MDESTCSSVDVRIYVNEGTALQAGSLFCNGYAALPVTVYWQVTGTGTAVEAGVCGKGAEPVTILDDFNTYKHAAHGTSYSDDNIYKTSSYPDNFNQSPPDDVTNYESKTMYITSNEGCPAYNSPGDSVDVYYLGWVQVNGYVGMGKDDPSSVVIYTAMQTEHVVKSTDIQITVKWQPEIRIVSRFNPFSENYMFHTGNASNGCGVYLLDAAYDSTDYNLTVDFRDCQPNHPTTNHKDITMSDGMSLVYYHQHNDNTSQTMTGFVCHGFLGNGTFSMWNGNTTDVKFQYQFENSDTNAASVGGFNAKPNSSHNDAGGYCSGAGDYAPGTEGSDFVTVIFQDVYGRWSKGTAKYDRSVNNSKDPPTSVVAFSYQDMKGNGPYAHDSSSGIQLIPSKGGAYPAIAGSIIEALTKTTLVR